MRRCTGVVFAFCAILFLNGCCVYESVCIRNSSGHDIEFYTGHTNLRYVIKSDAVETIPHADGLCVIKCKAGETWNYSNISLWPDDGVKLTFTYKHKYIVMREVVLDLSLDKDGTLYYLSPDRDERKSFKQNQPTGFPLKPIKQ